MLAGGLALGNRGRSDEGGGGRIERAENVGMD